MDATARIVGGQDEKRALGGLTTPRAGHEDKDSDAVVEACSALPTPASRISVELESLAGLAPLPAARIWGSARAAPQSTPASPAGPLPTGSSGRGLPPPLPPSAISAVDALRNMAEMAEGWKIKVARCLWWTLTAARDHREAREVFEHHLEELKWVEHLCRTMAASRTVLTGLDRTRRRHCGSTPGLANRTRLQQLRDPAVTDDQVERLVGFWLSGTGGMTAFMGPGRASLSEFLNGVYRTGQALLGLVVAVAVPAGPAAPPAASAEQGAAAQPEEPASDSSPPGATDMIEPPPPIPTPRTEDLRSPPPLVATRISHVQVELDGVANGSASRSPDDGSGSAADSRGEGSSAELSREEQPASKRALTPGSDVVQLR
ncbi:hypothetical protein Emag_006611 [Eimeria magna]